MAASVFWFSYLGFLVVKCFLDVGHMVNFDHAFVALVGWVVGSTDILFLTNEFCNHLSGTCYCLPLIYCLQSMSFYRYL